MKRMVISHFGPGARYQEVLTHLGTLHADTNFRWEDDALVVIADANHFVTDDFIRIMGRTLGAWGKRRGGAKWALVVPELTAAAMCTLRLKDLDLGKVMARVFPGEEEAWAWLRPRRA